MHLLDYAVGAALLLGIGYMFGRIREARQRRTAGTVIAAEVRSFHETTVALHREVERCEAMIGGADREPVAAHAPH